jgi:O-antigen ligase
MIGLAWTLPFLQPFHRFPLAGFYSEWIALALGLAGALALLPRASSGEIALPAVALAPLALAVVLAVQAALGRPVYAEQALAAGLYLSWAALLVVLGHHLRRELGTETLAATLAWWSLAGGALSAVVGLLQHFPVAGVPGWLVFPKSRLEIYGNLGQANHYAAHLSIAIAGALYLYGRGRLAGAWLVPAFALLLPPLALSGSRSAWIYVVLPLLLAFLVRGTGGAGGMRRLRIAALCLPPAFLAAHWLVALSFPAASVPAAPAVTSSDRLFQVATGMELRLQLWKTAWQMFLDAPVLGAGIGQFTWNHFVRAAGDASMDPHLYMHAHNLVLHLMAETGAIGALIVVGALLGWAAALRHSALDMEMHWLLCVLAIVGMHSLLEFPLWYAYFLGIAALLLGAGGRPGLVFRFSGTARAVVATAIVAGCVTLGAVMTAYREFERLVFLPEALAARPADDAAFARAIAGLYREPLLVPYVELAIAYGVEVNEDRLGDKLALTGRAVHFAPVGVVAYRHALLLAMAGEREQALAQLDRALRIYPKTGARTLGQLAELARRHPERFLPLLESAVRSATRAPRSNVHD